MKQYLLLLPILGITGCTLFGSSPSAPTKLERAIFDVVTNYVTVVKTNEVIAPRFVEVPVQVTNTLNQFVWQTNSVQQFVTNEVPVLTTNEQYTYNTKDSTRATASGVGALGNIVAPGSGGMIASGILGILAIWGHLRSSKNQTTAAALAQQVETVREFIKTLPQGTKYDTVITQWLQTHQVETGTANQVLALLRYEVSNPEAKAAVTDIQDTIKAITGTT